MSQGQAVSAGGSPDTLGGFIRSLGGADSRPVVDDLSHDPLGPLDLAGHVAATCAALSDAGVPPGATIAVRAGLDAPSVVALLAAAAYGVAVPVASSAPLPTGPFEVSALVSAVMPTQQAAAQEAPVVIDVSALPGTVPGDVSSVPVREPMDPALLLPTSGTTGEPKWVRLGQRNLIAAGTFIAGSLHLSPADRGLSIMALHHGHGITAGVLAPLLSGGTMIIVDSSDLEFLQEALRCDISWYSAAPTVHRSLLVARQSWPAWFKTFHPRVIRSTSEALPSSDRAQLMSQFAAPVIEAYALTEVPGQVCTQVSGTETEAGWMPPQAGVEVETVDADGRPTRPEVPGQVRVRGPNVMLGYLGHEPVAPDGWYLTSDIGVRRADGAVRVLGRDSDAIRRGGETIAPAVVESLVEQHPDIERARVCGMPHDGLGEQICVAVISVRGAAAGDELLRELRLMLPTHLTPSELRVVETFPGNPEGKTRRSDLRPLFMSGP